jgi:hypothetical protein
MEYIATKGFWVPVTTPCMTAKFEAAEIEPAELEPPPHPAIKAHTINDAAVTRADLTGDSASIFSLTGSCSEMIQRHYQGIAGRAGNQRSLAKALDFRNIWDQPCECRPR